MMHSASFIKYQIAKNKRLLTILAKERTDISQLVALKGSNHVYFCLQNLI